MALPGEDPPTAEDIALFKASMTATVSEFRYIDGVARLRSVCLMLCGSGLGACGFVFAAYLGIKTDLGNQQWNIDGEPFASGNNYFPETVSEMVSDPDSPSGKCFFAFVLTGAICILLSWYPWMLHNVYVGDDVWSCQGFKGVFLNLRSLLPPIGMLMVACIRVLPAPHRTQADNLTCTIHTLGACSAIGGFCGLEFLTLLVYNKTVRFSEGEWGIRLFLSCCCAVAIIAFQLGGLLAGSTDFGSRDVWTNISMGNVENAKANGKYYIAQENLALMQDGFPGLSNTASGKDLFIKKLEFWGEVFAGLFMIASHWVIWYFCPERQLDLDDAMPELLHKRVSGEGEDEDEDDDDSDLE